MNAIARWVSVIGHPFVMVAVMVAAVALRHATRAEAARIVVIVIVITLVPIAILMIRQVRRGSWNNVDASNASERPVLFAVGIVGVAILIAYSLYFQPASFLVRGSIGVLMMLACCAFLVRWVKVSLHMAFCALAATILVLLDSPMGWAFLLFLPVLAWSRYALGRHRQHELVLGSAIGLATGLAIYFV